MSYVSFPRAFNLFSLAVKNVRAYLFFFVSKNPAPLLWIVALDFRVHKLGMCKFRHSMNKPFNDIQKRLGQLRIFFYDKGDILFSGDLRRLTNNGCDLVENFKGPEQEEKLKALREKYFQDEANTIEREENDKFFQFERPHIYGRN
jgi:hypothetical protein